jgi:hypothetical protein
MARCFHKLIHIIVTLHVFQCIKFAIINSILQLKGPHIGDINLPHEDMLHLHIDYGDMAPSHLHYSDINCTHGHLSSSPSTLKFLNFCLCTLPFSSFHHSQLTPFCAFLPACCMGILSSNN